MVCGWMKETAISSVTAPERAESQRDLRFRLASAGWQQVKIRRRRSSADSNLQVPHPFLPDAGSMTVAGALMREAFRERRRRAAAVERFVAGGADDPGRGDFAGCPFRCH